MTQSKSNRHSTTYDYLVGVILVPVLHLVFILSYATIFIFLVIFSKAIALQAISLLNSWIIPYLGLLQIAYLLPIYAYFWHHNRRATTCKGLIPGAVATLGFTGACLLEFIQRPSLSQPAGDLSGVLMSVTIATFTAITIGLIGKVLVDRQMRVSVR